MSAPLDDRFCGHCGERLPSFGARLGYCTRCARRFRRAVRSQARFRDDWRRSQKDPLAAGIFSTLLPGGGQIYNGHFLKAVIFFVTAPLVIPWVIGIGDAVFSARRINDAIDEHEGRDDAGYASAA